METVDPRIHIIGVGTDGLAGLTARGRELLGQADLILGSEAVLRQLPAHRPERFVVGADLQETINVLTTNRGRRLVILASGDPLFYGVARYLCDRMGKDRFEVLPHVSTMQLAFARIKESWKKPT